jgi:hypothetical protein
LQLLLELLLWRCCCCCRCSRLCLRRLAPSTERPAASAGLLWRERHGRQLPRLWRADGGAEVAHGAILVLPVRGYRHHQDALQRHRQPEQDLLHQHRRQTGQRRSCNLQVPRLKRRDHRELHERRGRGHAAAAS